MIEDSGLNGRYHLQTTRDRNMWRTIPGSDRIFVDGGAVIFYDAADNIILAVGPGEWVEVVDQDTFDAMHELDADEL